MKLSEEIEKSLQLIPNKESRINAYELSSNFLNKIKQLEMDKEELLNALIEIKKAYVKLRNYEEIIYIRELSRPIYDSEKLIEKHKDNK